MVRSAVVCGTDTGRDAVAGRGAPGQEVRNRQAAALCLGAAAQTDDPDAREELRRRAARLVSAPR